MPRGPVMPQPQREVLDRLTGLAPGADLLRRDRVLHQDAGSRLRRGVLPSLRVPGRTQQPHPAFARGMFVLGRVLFLDPSPVGKVLPMS